MTQPRALLLGENSQGSSHLTKLLTGQGCLCEFANSYEQACSALTRDPFDLVLSPMRLRENSIFPLVSLLEGSGATLFYFQLVEDGCWWLPALRFGRRCFGSYALRPSEFTAVLKEIIGEVRMRQAEAATEQPVNLVSSSAPIPPFRWLGSSAPRVARMVYAEGSQLARSRATG